MEGASGEWVGDVVTEVEVVRINPQTQSLRVTAVDVDPVPVLPADRLRPGEDPVDAARRVLRDEVGISVVHHEPHFLGYRVYDDRQAPAAVLTLSFLVLGPVPGNSFDDTIGVSMTRVVSMGRLAIDHPATVIDALDATVELLATTPIALQLLGEKVTVFRLQDLLEVYDEFLRPSTPIDVSNFRRKVEGARDFVRPVDPPSPSKVRGRPARWYTAGEATRLDPPIRFQTRP